MPFPRSSGVLLHITSLPGKYGIGDMGEEAYHFADFLANTKQTYWQVLPLNPADIDSPYTTASMYAGNTLLLSPQKLCEEGFISQEDIDKNIPDFPSSRKVDFSKVVEFKKNLLSRAFANFQNKNDWRKDFENFCDQHKEWINDYALFRAIKWDQDRKPWYNWETKLSKREDLDDTKKRLASQIEEHKFHQFLFFKQWHNLRSYCNDKGIKIVGDIPFLISQDSLEVWRNPENFLLNPDGTPTVVVGVPGQRWGNPMYNWEVMKENGFKWWISRFRSLNELVDIIRIDHFRGFAGTYVIPSEEESSDNGEWVPAPGKDLFTALQKEFGDLNMIVEDLGWITDEVEDIRDSFGLTGMRLLINSFEGGAPNINLPHHYHKNLVAYTGTHDNETAVGWLTSSREEGADELEMQKRYALEYLHSDGKEFHWDLIRAAFSSVADIAIIPLQDLLGFGSDARMNSPGITGDSNWAWRFEELDLKPAISERLLLFTEIYGREFLK